MPTRTQRGQGQWALGDHELLNGNEPPGKDDDRRRATAGMTAAGRRQGGAVGVSGERLPPFYCPYCGEENLGAAGRDGGEWHCGACARTFELRPAAAPPAAGSAAAGRPGTAGRVALVGGGPGDPGLLTVRGRRLLDEADVVVTDRLAPRDVLADLRPGVEIVEAGKSPNAVAMTQEQINDLIVSRARAGRRVVRLKGGDPFVFGRGGEEALACAAAGIACDVVPGVTSAVAGPASAGIPVTHRGLSQGFAVVAAHLDPDQPGAPDWAALAAAPDTLVLLMAMARLRGIAEVLVKHGRPADTPVAVICEATTPRQRVLVTTLGGVAATAAAHSVLPPAVVVVGDVVRLRSRIGGTA